MPASPFQKELRRLAEPLRDSTNKVRRSLLLWSLASLAVTLGKLYPSEVSALGMKVTATSHSVLLGLMALIVGYHIVAFIIYGASDFMNWYVADKNLAWEEDVAYWEGSKAEMLARTKLSDEDRELIEEHERRLGSIWRAEASRLHARVENTIPLVSRARAAFDFGLPIVVGIGAVVLLVRAASAAL